MSFPNIPDINPNINITFEDAINLLLTSIAMEEISLSKLMDAETSKILCVLDNCKHDNCKRNDCLHKDCLHETLEINKSVDDTIKNMIKLQMLLQFKLDNIKEILPCTNSTTTTSSSTSTTTTCTKTTTTETTSSTTTYTTTCTTSTCSTTTNNKCCYYVTGRGKGIVPNCCDEFYNHIATLYAFIYCCDVKNKTIRYSVGNDENGLCMHASGNYVKTQCPCQCPDKIVIFGKGYAEKHSKCNPDIMGNVDFFLTIYRKACDNVEFRMEIKSENNPKLDHDSGLVQVNGVNSNLRLMFCC